MRTDKKYKSYINIILQVVILITLGYFFYQKFEHNELDISLNYLMHSFDDHYFLWILVLLLMPLNWYVEALKWKRLCVPLFLISIGTAIKGVLTGISLSFITPHGWGDYLGRIGILKEEEREKLIGALFFGKMTQLFITVVAGVLGLILYLEVWPYLYFWYLFSFFFIAILLAFNKTIFRILKPYLSKLRRLFSIIKKYDAKAILHVLFLSAVRYIVFTIQFIIIIKLLQVDLAMVYILGGVTWIFLIKSIVPSFNFLSDLGIREVSAIMFFENYLPDVSPIISATFIIWIVNILVPAVIGTLFVFSVKAFR